MGNPDHFVEYIKASIGEAKRLVKQFAIPNVFDFETIERNLGRIESALKVVEKGDLTPYQYIDALQRETENQRIEGITVDKISEGLTIKIDNATRQIRPPISITSLAVDRCLSGGSAVLRFRDCAWERLSQFLRSDSFHTCNQASGRSRL